jgi:hypothetical protein
VKVTLAPEHIVVEGDAAMLTLAATLGFTVIVSAFDVAGDPVAHARLDVITQVITLPFARAVVVYVALLVPTFVAPTFH